MSSSPAEPMPASQLAHRLIVGQLQGDADHGAMVAAAERVCTLMPAGMSRWFGPYGSHALMTRALARAAADHPALATVTVDATRNPCLVGLSESATIHGAEAAIAGAVAMLTALATLIGRLIGDDLAGQILEQSLTSPSTADAVAATTPAAASGESRSSAGEQP